MRPTNAGRQPELSPKHLL